MKPLVIQTETLPKECSEWLAKRCDLQMCSAGTTRFQEILPKAMGLVIRTYTTVDREMLGAAPNLRVVGRAGAGVDNIDIAACTEKGIKVVNTPDANSTSVVEFVVTTMLSKLRNITPLTETVDQKEWDILRDISITKKEFTETTIGIIGFGRIGSKLGKMASGMGFRVLFVDPLHKTNTHGCTQVALEQLLAESDVVSIHVDGRNENTHFCNAKMFNQMKPSVVFINTSRGFVIDECALAEWLGKQPPAIAILDVHNPEPIPQEYPLRGLSNANLYPHVACKTKTASVNMGWVVKDIDKVLRGDTPTFLVC